MLGYRFTDYQPDPNQQEGQSTFDQLLKIFMELMVITSGDVGETLEWMNNLDRQYNMTNDEYGMGDFIQDLKDKGYITDENPQGSFELTAKTERSIRKSALEEIFGKLKKSGSGNHKTNFSGTGDEASTDRRNYEFGDSPYTGFEATQPVNGSDAQLAGFEVNLQQQLTFLPGALSGLGIYGNYTYSWSEAELINSDGEARTVTLPGQAENTGNVALSYERSGFSGRVSLSYAGSFVEELRDEAGNDRIYDEHIQLDLSASQRLNQNFTVFLELINLTNEPLRYYNGVSSRPEQQEFYSFWGNIGVKFEL